DATLWQFGASLAQTKPEFLEFACDWTGEAVKFFPAHPGLAEQRAHALLLHGRTEEAGRWWGKFASSSNPSHRAALLICATLLHQPLPPVPPELAARVNQEFIAWYRRLLAANAATVVSALNQRTATLRRVVPAATQIL